MYGTRCNCGGGIQAAAPASRPSVHWDGVACPNVPGPSQARRCGQPTKQATNQPTNRPTHQPLRWLLSLRLAWRGCRPAARPKPLLLLLPTSTTNPPLPRARSRWVVMHRQGVARVVVLAGLSAPPQVCPRFTEAGICACVCHTPPCDLLGTGGACEGARLTQLWPALLCADPPPPPPPKP